MNKKRIVVLGSSNLDYISEVESLPIPGQTVIGNNFRLENGGKGANQAVAVKKLGGDISFICCIGNDIAGNKMIDDWNKIGMNLSGVKVVNNNFTGCAQILIDSKGENCIVVSQGANSSLNEEVIASNCETLKKADFLLLQLETPVKSSIDAAKIVSSSNGKIILNPAPALEIPDSLFKYIDIITPNKSEASEITGVDPNNKKFFKLASTFFHEKKINEVIITLGDQGVYYSKKTAEPIHIPSYNVKAIDTVAAGDTFNGALVVKLAENITTIDAIKYAQAAAALSVAKKGAQSSIPTASKVKSFLAQNI